MGSGKYKIFIGFIAVVLLVIAYNAISQRQASKTAIAPEISNNTGVRAPYDSKKTDSRLTGIEKTAKDGSQSVDKQNLDTDTTPNPGDSSLGQEDIAIKILKSEVSKTAKFYPYNLDGTKMEIIAVKATDGTIRTALNTCQICWDSGRGYYIQEGEYLVCQNCGNQFHIDQIEKIKGGCNPVPILEKDKTDMGNSIAITKEFLATQKGLFSNWKTS